MFLQFITESGNLFQTVAAAQEKPLDAVTVLVRGTVSNGRVEERSEYPVLAAGTSRSFK